jgi:hypothetical protein
MSDVRGEGRGEEGQAAPNADGALPKRAWGVPFVKLDEAWTRLEARLCAWVLAANVLALCGWVFLNGMSAEGNGAAIVFRAFAGASVLGFIAHMATKNRSEVQHSALTTGAVIVGLLTGHVWAHFGVAYASNVLNWLQNATVFMLIGGLRTPGLATRLTLWLALLGASMATAEGKHINIDVMMRFLAPKRRVPVAVLGWIAAAVMCVAGAWGFFDHVAIQGFHIPKDEPCAGRPDARCDLTPSRKIAVVAHHMKSDVFLVGRQLSLDLRSFPRVVMGTPYDQYMPASEWNAWLAGADWKGRYPAEDVQALVLPIDTPERMKMPAVSVPGGGEDARGLLAKDLDFVFVFAFLMIALRFVLRALLAISGHVKVDPDAVHGEAEVAEHHVPPPPPPRPAASKEVA